LQPGQETMQETLVLSHFVC